jgi:hypothetical protein
MNPEDFIKSVEQSYPETCEEFKIIQLEQYETFCRKQFDYGPHNISLGSDLHKKEDIVASISAIVVRLNDKIQRLINLVLRKKTFETANEPVFDAFSDTAVYCIIAEIVKRKKWCK